MNENKWKWSNISNIVLAALLLGVVGLLLVLLPIYIFPLIYAIELSSAETGYNPIKTLLLVILIGYIGFCVVLGICHAACISTERKVKKNGGFVTRKQRGKVKAVMCLDIFFAIIGAMLFAFEIYLSVVKSSLSKLGFAIDAGWVRSLAIEIFLIISAVCKSSIIKLPYVTPDQNIMSPKVHYNGANNGAYIGSYNKPHVEKTVIDNKWVLLIISNVFFKIVFPVTAVLLLLLTPRFSENIVDSRYFEIFDWMMPLVAAIYAICHMLCHSADKHVMKNDCLKSVGQRYCITAVMVLDIILAFLALLLLGSDIFIVIRVGGSETILTGLIYVICAVVIFFAATSAVYKASMIKLPVGTPKQNNEPYNGLNNDPFNGSQPPNPWNRY